MRLSRKVLDAYNAAIKKQGDNAENAARKALEAWFEENPTATVADAREFSIALMNEVGSFYGNAAGDVAYALRDIAAEAAGVELEPVDYEYAPEAEYVSKAAHYQAGKLVDGDRPDFVDGIASSSRYFAERGANDTMAALGAADGKRLGKRVRFARVPTGATNCPFCIMLASRGFVYKSELSALNANHPNCDCRIVEGFDGMEVEGYDQEYYQDCYAHPDDHPEIRDAINARRRELYAQSSAKRRAETKIQANVPDATKLSTAEGIAIRDNESLQKAFKPETAARLGASVENSIVSGDATRANAAKVFRDAVEDDARYARLSNGVDKAQYNPATKQVEIQADFDADPRTVVHETFHLRDFQQSIPYGQYGWKTTGNAYSSMRFSDSSGCYLKNRILDDWGALESQAAAEGKTTEEYLRGRIETAGLRPIRYEDSGFVSDMIDAASNGVVRFSGGHTYADPDYWNHAGAVQTEFLANYGGSAVCNPVEYELMRELFPTSCGTMDEIIEAMANV